MNQFLKNQQQNKAEIGRQGQEGQVRQEGQGRERMVGEREWSVVTGGSGERGKDHGKQSRGVRKKRGGQ